MAVEAAARGVAWTAMDVSGAVCDALVASAALLRGDGVTWEGLLSAKQRAKWDAGRPTVEPDTLKAMAEKGGWPADWMGTLCTA
jgi:protein-disulfide isomerase-like protein with CxxC motif